MSAGRGAIPGGALGAVLIVNTAARRGARLYAPARRRLIEAGLSLEAAYPVRHAERLPGMLRQLVADGHRFVIVGGGDGTINAAAEILARTGVVLGILPMGTANSFARGLGVPVDLAGAVEVLAGGRVVDVDLIGVNDGCCVNGVSIGLPAAIAQRLSPGVKRWFGRIGYLVVAGSALARHRPFQCDITVDGQTTRLKVLDVRIANGDHQGGYRAVRHATPTDGRLAVRLVEGEARWLLVAVWLRTFLGRPPASRLSVQSGCELCFRAEPSQYVAADGEVVSRTPVRISLLRGALRVMAPRRDRADG